jgi:tRNA(Ile)-lysidine synthase
LLQTAAGRFGAELIATGHHADDRAETVLMRLLRGAGPRGLAVLPARSGGRVRPMIRARKADVLAHLERHAIDYVDDPSNQDRRFLRVRVRLELLPLLEALSPRIVEHLNALADQIEAGAPPRLLDANGEPIVLGREQARQLRRAQALGLGRVRVRLAGGREATVDPKTGQISLLLPWSPRPRRVRRRAGGAEPRQRG